MFIQNLTVALLGLCIASGLSVPTAPSVADDHWNAPGKRDARCPTRNGAMPVFLPHESSCASYYVCDTGLAIPLSCPHHLLFNKDKNVCDHPESVDCGIEPNTYKRGAGYAAQDDEVEVPVGKKDPRCPAKNPALPVYLSHETDCTKFYICETGMAFEKTCQFGLFFNTDINVCDFAHNVDCQDGQRSYLRNPRYSDPASYSAQSGKRNARCPRRNPGTPVLLSHESDCTKFYICESGLAFEKSCQHNLFFNPDINVCDYPNNVDCQHEQGLSNRGRDAVDGRARQTNSACPKVNSLTLKFLEHPSDCGKYYVCDWGRAILMHCPVPMGFDPDLNVCSAARPC